MGPDGRHWRHEIAEEVGSATKRTMSVRIVVADDHPVIVRGICCWVTDQEEPIQLATHVNSVDQISPAVAEFVPDVLVSEVRLGGQDVLKQLESLLTEQPELNVVIFSSEQNPTHIARASALGCRDYVLKTAPPQVLLSAVHTASRGCDPPASSLMVKTRSRMRRPRQAHAHDVPLTNREMQVLQHVAMGLSNREISKSLSISVETVKEHVQNILRKLDVNDRTQAAVWAVKRRLF